MTTATASTPTVLTPKFPTIKRVAQCLEATADTGQWHSSIEEMYGILYSIRSDLRHNPQRLPTGYCDNLIFKSDVERWLAQLEANTPITDMTVDKGVALLTLWLRAWGRSSSNYTAPVDKSRLLNVERVTQWIITVTDYKLPELLELLEFVIAHRKINSHTPVLAEQGITDDLLAFWHSKAEQGRNFSLTNPDSTFNEDKLRAMLAFYLSNHQMSAW